jgi:ComF family protein
MNTSINYLIDFFLPRICPGCNIKLSTDKDPVCDDCLNSILIADEERLKVEYDKDFGSSGIIKGYYSKFVFETDKTLQQIIHALKYNQKFKLGEFLGKILAEGIKTKDWQLDVIIPVPIHHLKKAERGYNQSDYIAKGLSKSLQIPYSLKSIKRIRYTDSQTGLKMNDRASNVANAFKVKNTKKITRKNILIVDDVCTTGATLQACGKVLKDAGTNSVYACSIAIAD